MYFFKIALPSITAFATVIAAIAAWKAASASEKSAKISKDLSEFQFKTHANDKLTNPIEDAKDKALLKCKDGKTYLGDVEIDLFGNIFCRNVYEHKSIPVKPDSIFYLPEQYRLKQIWVNPNEIKTIIFFDEQPIEKPEYLGEEDSLD